MRQDGPIMTVETTDTNTTQEGMIFQRRLVGQHRNGAKEPEFITVSRMDYKHPTVKKARKSETRKKNKAARKSRARNR